MSAARPLPELGSIFLDARGGDRALRVSWHSEADLVVLSLWRDNVCAASFRLSIEEVPELIDDAARRPRPRLPARADAQRAPAELPALTKAPDGRHEI